jgi:hypothetical protein
VSGLRSVRITPLGALLLLALVVGLVLGSIGPKSTQAPGFAVAAVAALTLTGAALSRGTYGGAYKSLAQRREEFDSPGAEVSGPSTEVEQEQFWRKERERRERDAVD